MKTFINKTIDTLSDSNVSSNSLVKILIESTKNSLETNSGISSTYNSLKNGLVELNDHLKNDTITYKINVMGDINNFKKSIENNTFFEFLSEKTENNLTLRFVK